MNELDTCNQSGVSRARARAGTTVQAESLGTVSRAWTPSHSSPVADPVTAPIDARLNDVVVCPSSRSDWSGPSEQGELPAEEGSHLMSGSRSRVLVRAGALVLARSRLSLAIAVLLVATAGPTSTRAAEPPTRTRLTNAGSPTRITNDGIAYDPTPIVATSGRDALIAYNDGDGNLSILRTADAGATWRGPTSLSAPSSYVWRAAALAAFGRHVRDRLGRGRLHEVLRATNSATSSIARAKMAAAPGDRRDG